MTQDINDRSVVITGIGMVTSLGLSAAETWSGLVAGKTRIRRIQRFDTEGLATKFGGELPDAYDGMELEAFPRRMQNQISPSARLGFICARQAMEDSGFTGAVYDPYRVAVVTGSGSTGLGDNSADLARPHYAVIRNMANAAAAWISIKHGLKGASLNVATACASGAFAVALGLDLIRQGRADAVVVVGMDRMLTRECLGVFGAILALSEANDTPEQASRPFDLRRTGFVMAEGGAALMLEAAGPARARGARLYARIRGAAMTSEAHNIVAPAMSGEEMARTMALALTDAGVSPEDIGYVNAHGTSTQLNDAIETQAIKLVFGAHAKRLAVSSVKSMLGHSIGGSGAIECAATALALHHRILTPTINQTDPDPACDLDYVPNVAREAPDLRVALSNSFGFGGHNCSIVLDRFP